MVNVTNFTKYELRILANGMDAYKKITSDTGKWDIARILATQHKQEIIVCDNKTCNHVELATSNQWACYYNTPCPKCGENLLTKEDLIRTFKVYIRFARMNQFFNWLMPKIPYWLVMKFFKGGSGNTFTIGSTTKEIHVEVCSACHPFYTGKMKYVDTAGRVDAFKTKRAKAQKKLLTKKQKREIKKQKRIKEEQDRPDSLEQLR